MNILYIHGFRSSGQTNTGNTLKNTLSDDNIFTPDIPKTPEIAIKFIDVFIKENNIDIIIGTSLGGLYAKQFNIPKIIINPAFIFPFKPGDYKFFNKREDNKADFKITEDDINYLKNLQSKCKYIISEYIGLSHILIGKQDELIDFNSLSLDDYTNDYDIIHYADFGHRLTDDIVNNEIVPLVNILKKQFKYIENYNPINF